MTIFPTLAPSSRTFTPGRHPHSGIPSMDGLQSRVRMSNTIIEQRLQLTFAALTEEQMLSIHSHYIDRQGRFLSFAIPNSLLSGMLTPASFTPTNGSWLYASSPQVEDVPGLNRYTVNVELVNATPENTTAGGITAAIAATLSAGSASATGPTDPDFSSVLLLLHGDGANDGVVFTDSSNYTRTVTAADISAGAATAVTKTAIKQFGTASIFINGGQDYLSVPYSTDWNFGSGDFTLEAWIYMTDFISSNPGEPQGIMCRGASPLSAPSFDFSINPGNGGIFARGMKFTFGTSDSTSTVYSNSESGQLYALNAWHHVAAVRDGANLRLFCNGVQAGSTHNVSTTAMYHSGSEVMQIGRNFSVSNSILGYVDDVRITKGVARYTAAFAPPTTAFPDA